MNRPPWKSWWQQLRFRIWPGGRGREEHPSVEMLAAYHDDQLSPEGDDEIKEHFVDCPECPELMLDLDRFTTPETVEAAKGDLSDAWVERAWKKLRARLAVDPRPAQSALRWLRQPLLAWGVTCLLTPCAIDLWFRAGRLDEEVRGFVAPQLNLPWLRIDPSPSLRGSEPAPPDLAVPADARQFLLILHSEDPSVHPEYRLEIRDRLGESLWKRRGLHKNEEGAFVVTLSRRFLPAGFYRFQVTGIAGGVDVPRPEEFPLRVTYR